MSTCEYTQKDFASKASVRWCAGCGDIAILNAVQKTFAGLNIPKEKFTVVSGIGCSSRFPYYVETYGYHSIHGRAPTLATGIKVANPDLSVWIATGDGDGLSIGGNHTMHLIRRNLDINVILFNNRIYGLTKGQYSPTSEVGKVTKTSPTGSIDHPIEPAMFAMGAETTFFARTVDNNIPHMIETFTAAANHKGTSFIEVMQNCVIFNHKTWDDIIGKDNRDDNMIVLEEGKPMIFGKERNKGIIFDQGEPKVVTIGENGITEADLVVHRPENKSPMHALMLAQMSHPEFPVPIGTFRKVTSRPNYDKVLEDKIVEQKEAKGEGTFADLLRGHDSWEVT